MAAGTVSNVRKTLKWGSPFYSVERQKLYKHVTRCGYTLRMTSAGILELKDNLSHYIRRIEAGERIAITAHGRVVAELVPPGSRSRGTPSRFDEIVASEMIRQPLKTGSPTKRWPDIRLPAGTAAKRFDTDRKES